MSTMGLNYTKRPMAQNKTDSLEKEKPRSVGGTIASFGSDTLKKTGEGVADIGKGIFEQLLGTYKEGQTSYEQQKPQEQEHQQGIRPEGGTLFSFRSLEEERQMNEIKQILKQIKEEIEQIKKNSAQMMDRVKDIESTEINATEEQKGVYFLNMILDFLKELQKISMEVGNSNNWMEAMTSKRAKRGSLFAARSKKSGTSYSMSQELSTSRSVQ